MSVQRQPRWLQPTLHLLLALCTTFALLALLALLRLGAPAQASARDVAGPSAESGYSQSVAAARQNEELTHSADPPEPTEPAMHPPVRLELQVTPAQAWPGELVTLTVRIHAEADVPEAELRTVLPSGLVFVRAPGGRYVVEDRTVYWPLAPLRAGTSAELDCQARMDVEACQADNPSVRGSYHTWMPTGKNWHFHHWIRQGSAYVDDYCEFSAGSLEWSPRQYLAYDYDALDRLSSAVPYTAAWQGYTATYAYNAIGNLTGWDSWSYAYGNQPHAVTTVAIPPYQADKSFSYDANGNMVTRTVGSDTYILSYDAENRLKQVKKNGVVTATFGYDGDGRMVTATVGVTTTYYVGNYFELVNGITHTYYYHGGKRIAMRVGNTLYWLLTDHLGSTALIVRASEAITGELRYRAYGEARDGWGITTTTKYHFTGQREESSLGLYFYNARWYDAALGRFAQADTMVQTGATSPMPYLPLAVSYASPRTLEQWNQFQRAEQSQGLTLGSLVVSDPQFLNRYTYARGNPLAYVDDSGQIAWWIVGGVVGGVVGFGSYAITHRDNFEWRQAALWTAGGAVVGATLGAGAQWVAGVLGTEAAVTTGAVGTTGAATAGEGLNVFSRAAEFGIDAWTRLSAAIARTGLEAHHIIEQRFAPVLGLDVRWIPSVALTPEEHEVFTSAWRQLIPYGTSGEATLEQIWEAVQIIYARYPELLEAARQTLFH